MTTTTTSGDQTLPKSIAAREVDRELSDEKPTQQRETNEQSSGDTTEVFPTEENVPLPREAEELPPALSLDPQISSGNSDDEKEREAPKVDIQRNSVSHSGENGSSSDGHALVPTYIVLDKVLPPFDIYVFTLEVESEPGGKSVLNNVFYFFVERSV